MNTWTVRLGLWLARQGGWTLPEPPAPLPVGPEAELQARVQQAESKLQMRNVELHDALDRVRMLETRLAQPHAPSVTPALMARVHELIHAYMNADLGGEAKRHAVYARLIKDFPTTPKRALAMAIEVALAQEG